MVFEALERPLAGQILRGDSYCGRFWGLFESADLALRFVKNDGDGGGEVEGAG